MKTLLHPQEIETFYLIPTIRRYFALFMKEKGIKQKDIANLMGINSATISQYTSSKRGHKINFAENIQFQIKQAANRIKDTSSYFRETQMVLEMLRKEKILCHVHKAFSAVPENCSAEEVGCKGC